jgi:hypothetical protein
MNQGKPVAALPPAATTILLTPKGIWDRSAPPVIAATCLCWWLMMAAVSLLCLHLN